MKDFYNKSFVQWDKQRPLFETHFAKNHNFKNEDLLLYTTSSTVISGLSTQINYHVTVVNENKFKLSIAGISTNISRENYVNKKYVSFDSVGVGTHKFSYPPIQINVEVISGIATTIVKPSLDPIILGSFDDIFIENNKFAISVF